MYDQLLWKGQTSKKKHDCAKVFLQGKKACKCIYVYINPINFKHRLTVMNSPEVGKLT